MISITAVIYRKSQASTPEQAKQDGALYRAESVYSPTQAMDATIWMEVGADCLDASASKNDIMISYEIESYNTSYTTQFVPLDHGMALINEMYERIEHGRMDETEELDRITAKLLATYRGDPAANA